MDIRTFSYYPASSVPSNTTEDNTKDAINQRFIAIMLLSLKIDDQIVKAYDIYLNDYKIVIAKIKVLLVTT